MKVLLHQTRPLTQGEALNWLTVHFPEEKLCCWTSRQIENGWDKCQVN
jgi:hypothetical protein